MALATSPIALALTAQKSKKKLRKPPPWLHPRQIERNYARALQTLAKAFARQVRETVIAALPSLAGDAEFELGHQDALPDDIARLMEVLRLSVPSRTQQAEAMAIDIGQRTSEWNDKEWQKILQSTLGVGLVTAEPGLRERLRLFVQTNANLVTNMQTEAISKIEGIVERGFAAGTRHTEIAKEIRKQLDVTESRARLIARDQASKLNGQLTRMRQEEAGITKYVWQTADDARVRATHSPMDGKLGRWDNASLYANPSEPDKWLAKSGINAVELHPGQDFQCRCFPEPFIEELAESA
jgi:SPP1 gp7 family putative phage head morphogenesis protein